MSWVVTGPVAVVRIGDSDRFIERGGVLPDDLPSETVDHLVSVGLVEEVAEEAKPEPKPSAKK